MYDSNVCFYDAITAINWLEVIKTIAAIVAACAAFGALRTWRLQDKAKRESEFLDSLVEATHSYIVEMLKPITLLEVAKVGMESYALFGGKNEEANKAVMGAIAYIQKNGEKDAKRLREVLESVQPVTIKLRSLAAKGQVFKFDGYSKCQDAVAMLTRHFERIEVFMVILGSQTLNWENSEVSKLLKDVMAIDPTEIRVSFQENNVTIITFASEAYKRIYG